MASSSWSDEKQECFVATPLDGLFAFYTTFFLNIPTGHWIVTVVAVGEKHGPTVGPQGCKAQ